MITDYSKPAGTIGFRPPKTIVLVGMMGAGKTSIGRRLAKKLELPFYDSDQEVELAAGCPIKQFVDIYGEDAFKNGECRVIARLLDQQVHVLATGGTSFLNESIRQVVKEKAISVWLKADLETILARVSRRNDRPFLIQDGTERETIEQMIAERYPLYSLADVTVDTFDESTNLTVDRVIGSLTDFIRVHFPTEYVLKSI